MIYITDPENHKLGAKIKFDGGEWIPIDDETAKEFIDGAFLSYKSGPDGEMTNVSLRENFIEFLDTLEKDM